MAPFLPTTSLPRRAALVAALAAGALAFGGPARADDGEGGAESVEQSAPAPIQKLMSVPIMDHDSNVLGVIQISRKGTDSRFAPDFSRDDLHDLETAAGVLASSPVLLES